MTSLASTLEHANQALFLVINAPAHPDTFMIGLATVFAQYAIWLLPARRPVEQWVKRLGPDLRDHRDGKDDREDAGTDQIAQVHGHRQRIAARFP